MDFQIWISVLLRVKEKEVLSVQSQIFHFVILLSQKVFSVDRCQILGFYTKLFDVKKSDLVLYTGNLDNQLKHLNC